MSRYIEADALIEVLKQRGIALSGTIADQPSIDIVRCKECTHWDRVIDENGIERFNFSKCVKGHYGNGFDFYCADGEREGE